MSWWRQQTSGAPGISFRVERGARARPEVRMDIACFVGLTERGPLGEPVVCDSWDDFLLRFGERGGFRLLPEAVHQFFVNGGRRCVIVRCIGEADTAQFYPRGVTLSDSSFVFLSARDPGRWGDDVDPALVPRFRPLAVSRVDSTTLRGVDSRVVAGSVLYFEAQDRYRLVESVEGSEWTLSSTVPAGSPVGDASEGFRMPGVFEVTLDFLASHGTRVERFEGLGLDVRHPRWVMGIIDEASWLVRPDPAFLEPLPLSEPTLTLVPDAPADSMLVSSGDDGTTTTDREVFLKPVAPGIVHYGGRAGAFEVMRNWDEGSSDDPSTSRELEPITQIVFPDLVHPGVYHPDELDSPDAPELEPSLRFETCASDEAELPDSAEVPPGSPYALLEVGSDFDDVVRRIARRAEADARLALVDVPPTYGADGIMALRKVVVSNRVAFYAPWLRVLNTDGSLWRLVGPSGSVAGIIASREERRGPGAIPANVDLLGILDLWEPSTLPADDFLHELRINRTRLDWGTHRLMGSRVAIDDSRSGHVNVQRLLLYLSRQLTIDGRFAVFQPNNEHLWSRLHQTIERRLARLHNQGALAGSSAAEAYRIKVDAELQTLQGLDNGEVRAHVGVAPAVPMEFIDVVLKLVADRGLEVVDG